MGRPRISLSPHGVRSSPNPVLNTQHSSCFCILVVTLKPDKTLPRSHYTPHPLTGGRHG